MDIVVDARKRAAFERSEGNVISAGLYDELAAEIESLRAQLAARDAEIAAWLRRADTVFEGLPCPFKSFSDLATAIEQGAYRSKDNG